MQMDEHLWQKGEIPVLPAQDTLFSAHWGLFEQACWFNSYWQNDMKPVQNLTGHMLIAGSEYTALAFPFSSQIPKAVS